MLFPPSFNTQEQEAQLTPLRFLFTGEFRHISFSPSFMMTPSLKQFKSLITRGKQYLISCFMHNSSFLLYFVSSCGVYTLPVLFSFFSLSPCLVRVFFFVLCMKCPRDVGLLQRKYHNHRTVASLRLILSTLIRLL